MDNLDKYTEFYIKCPVKPARRFHSFAIIAAYALALGGVSLMILSLHLPDSLLMLFLVPVVIAPLLGYGRSVYLPQTILLIIAAVGVTSIVSQDFAASLRTIFFALLSGIGMAEITRYLTRLRRAAEQALRASQEAARASEEKLAKVFQSSPASITLIRFRDGLYNDVNESQLRITGYRREEIVGHTTAELRIFADVQELQAFDRTLLAEGRVRDMECHFRIKSGEIRLGRISAETIKLDDETYVLAVVEDITEHKRTQERNDHLTTVLRAIRNVNQLITHERDRDRLIQGACESLVQARGYLYASLVLVNQKGEPHTIAEAGQEAYALSGLMNQAKLPNCIEQALSQSDPVVVNAPFDLCVGCLWLPENKDTGTLSVRLDYEGQALGVLSVSLPAHLTTDAEEQELFQEVAGDIAFALHSIEQEQKRREAEETLRQERNLLRTLIDLLPDGVFAKDMFGRKVLANRVDLMYMGLQNESEALGKTDFDTFPPEIATNFWADDQQVLQTGQPVINHQDRIIVDDQERWILTSKVPLCDSTGQIIGLVGVGHDITDYRCAELEKAKLQEQLLQSQKMEAIGRLAGGIAHDFNNHLTAINGYTELLLDELPPDHPFRADLEEIRKAAARSASLTRQLLAFSRRQILQLQPLNLNEVVADMENMLRRLIGEAIDLQLNLSPVTGTILADQHQIEQVILNLVVNAYDAMPDGGRLIVRTSYSQVDAEQTETNWSMLPGSYVTLSVIDNGIGMDEETQSHLFEPFFTTKPKGEGTGLGLATAYGIVKQSNGYILAASELGKGSTFTIYVPQIESTSQPDQAQVRNQQHLKGSETILLVEDENIVRTLAHRVLEGRGYTILEASNGVEALALLERYQDKIHLILTDVIMPGGLNGHALVEQVLSQRPEIKVLYMSGYTDDAIVHHGVLDPQVNLIAKPFRVDDLTRQVREVLDEA
ncbi:MAG: PAS domain S-box protein [Anaerolineae bacterium]|nr:PAS domain S-box protein [Anaerolineae bacterium]